MRLHCWRRWLAGQLGPAGRWQPHSAATTLGRGRYTLVVVGLREPHGTGATPESRGSMTHADPDLVVVGLWQPEPLATRRTGGLHWPSRPAAREMTKLTESRVQCCNPSTHVLLPYGGVSFLVSVGLSQCMAE